MFSQTKTTIIKPVMLPTIKQSINLIYPTKNYAITTFGQISGSIKRLNDTDNVYFESNPKLYNNAALFYTKKAIIQNEAIGSYAPFVKTFVIRGIGYQADIIENDGTNQIEFPYVRYLSLRVGHSFHLYKPIPNYIGIKVSHKDRKLVIYGANKNQVSNFAKLIFNLRPPSVYTGRGIRIKRGIHRRKLGKKDIRKGKV
jgi:ribosomal protein L6P/L9E